MTHLKTKGIKTMINQSEYTLRMKYGFVRDPYIQDDGITLDSDTKSYTIFYTPVKGYESIYDSPWYIYVTQPVFAKSEAFMYKIYSKTEVSYDDAIRIHELCHAFGCSTTDDDGSIMIPPIYTSNKDFRLQPCSLSTVPVDSHLSYQTR